MKKLSLLLAFMLTMCSFAACGDKDNNEDEEDSSSVSDNENEKDEDTDTYSGYSLKGEENKYFFSSWSHKK